MNRGKKHFYFFCSFNFRVALFHKVPKKKRETCYYDVVMSFLVICPWNNSFTPLSTCSIIKNNTFSLIFNQGFFFLNFFGFRKNWNHAFVNRTSKNYTKWILSFVRPQYGYWILIIELDFSGQYCYFINYQRLFYFLFLNGWLSANYLWYKWFLHYLFLGTATMWSWLMIIGNILS